MPLWSQMYLQDAGSVSMIWLASFHEHVMVFIVMIFTVVGYAMLSLILCNKTSRYIMEAHTIESIWTITPMLILMSLALPSLHILYMLEEWKHPQNTLKVIGHQWYWTYEHSNKDNLSLKFDSYMSQLDNLKLGEFRLLEVDHRMVLPMSSEIRILVTSSDVIHSWTIPALGIKMDAIPGRLNQLGCLIARPGVFYGQCSEICGANHSFMPIVLETVPAKIFTAWTMNNSL